ncbi:MAG: hypothetical protein A4E54_02072 [Pelotomaculum sp. PtaB.Bin117]|nr:MAG: hypothetical protein A4E54_02072 [Pelotomaculum sp. PtaB.Bin117]OPY60150.1 MAG: hypothetical protein A4E56_02878 [Pelotomaculum sp. PtaU1.Bin065]
MGQGEHKQNNRAGHKQGYLGLIVDHDVGFFTVLGNCSQPWIIVLSHGFQDKTQVKCGDAICRLVITGGGYADCPCENDADGYLGRCS